METAFPHLQVKLHASDTPQTAQWWEHHAPGYPILQLLKQGPEFKTMVNSWMLYLTKMQRNVRRNMWVDMHGEVLMEKHASGMGIRIVGITY